MAVEVGVAITVLLACIGATWLIKADNAATRAETATLAREVSALAATVREIGNLMTETRGKLYAAEHDLTAVRERLAHAESRLEAVHAGGAV